MTKRTIVFELFAMLALCTARSVQAQAPDPATEKLFVNVNIGAQLSDRSIDTAVSKPLYDETATLTSTIPVSGSVILDVSAGYRVWGDFYAALAVTSYRDSEAADYSTSVPHPLFFNRPLTTTGRTSDLKRSEVGIHPQIVWAHPLTDKLDIAVSGGPSFIRLSQDLLTDLSVPVGTQTGNPVLATQKGTAKGLHIGADVTYVLTPRYGVGGFWRYTKAKVDLPALSEAKTGGMQVGVGVRLRLL